MAKLKGIDLDCAKRARMISLRLADLAKRTDLSNEDLRSMVHELSRDTNLLMCELTRNDQDAKYAMWDIVDSGLDRKIKAMQEVSKEG